MRRRGRAHAGFDLFDNSQDDDDRRLNVSIADASDFIVDIREYDVPYHVRVMIDRSEQVPFPASFFLGAPLTDSALEIYGLASGTSWRPSTA